jgi:GntR family transcriptional repressor for pyruvate dehydrogenase complex
MDVPLRHMFVSIRSPNPLEETIERIADAIKTRLLSPGDRLPSERELAVQLGVSRSTLRVALRNLVAAGWFGKKSGRGFYRYDAQGNRLEPTMDSWSTA